MTTVCITFILNNATLGFGLSMPVSTISGVIAMLLITATVIKKSAGKGESELPGNDLPGDEQDSKPATETA